MNYVRGWCFKNKEMRSFRLDRIGLINGTQPRTIEPPEDFEEPMGGTQGPSFMPEGWQAPSSRGKPAPTGGGTSPSSRGGRPPAPAAPEQAMQLDRRDPNIVAEIRPKTVFTVPSGTSITNPNFDYSRPISPSNPATDKTFVEDVPGMFLDESRTEGIDPTPEEYKQLRDLDIHPPSFDRSVIRRLRNMGTSHVDLIDVGNSGIPYEDYETALKNNMGDHAAAREEALGYQKHYANIISANQNNRFSSPITRPEDYNNIVLALFQHHASLKNKPSFDGFKNEVGYGGFAPIGGRRRANEWIMHQLSRMNPELRKYMKTDYYRPESILTQFPVSHDRGEQGTYYGAVSALANHHLAGMSSASNLKNYMMHNRMIGILSNVGSSLWYPVDYHADIYEER